MFPNEVFLSSVVSLNVLIFDFSDIKMGLFYSKEWNEVVTSNSPGSPDQGVQDNKGGADPRRRVLAMDPRSISDDVSRTPIQVNNSKTTSEATPKTAKPAFLDPRSPSQDLPRTPLNFEGKNMTPEFAEDVEEPEESTKAQPPQRGTTIDSTEVKDIRKKLEDLEINPEEPEQETEAKGEVVNDEIVQEANPAEESKEDGEITHDSDDDFEDQDTENKKPLTPVKAVKAGKKTLLESDCRSPLLIENGAAHSYEKGLANELSAMANMGKIKRLPLTTPKAVNNVQEEEDTILI